MTFQILGCSECQWIWVVKQDDSRETVKCRRCEASRDASLARTLYETDDAAEAHDVRGAYLADRAGHLEDYEDVPAYAELDERWKATVHVDDPRPHEHPESHPTDPAQDDDSGPATRSSVGEGPQVDVDVAEHDLLQTSGIDRPDLDDTFTLTSSPNQPVSAHIYEDTSPKSSHWLPDVLDDLIPTGARLVQEITTEAYPDGFDGRVDRLVDDVLLEVANVDADAAVNVRDETRTYMNGLAKYSLFWTDADYLAERGHLGHQYVNEVLGPDRETGILRTIGTGRGPMNAPLDAVRHGPAALHALAEQPPVFVFELDADAWMDAHNDTVEHALEAFDALASGVDIRLVAAPAVVKTIKRAARRVSNRDGETPTWATRLTQTGDSSRRVRPADSREEELPLADAYDLLTDGAHQAGKRDILLFLPTDAPVSVRDVKAKADADVLSVGRSTVGRYLPELADLGLVEKTTYTTQSNEYALTALGRAARRLLNDDGSVTHPFQLSLDSGRYRQPPAARKCSVTPQSDTREEWLSSTGDPTDHNRWVQFVGDSSEDRRLQPNAFHDRLLANRRVEGVSLVDEPIENFRDHEDGDGRVTYLSAFSDEVLAMTQWAGAAATLARFANAILSPLAWNGILHKTSNTAPDTGGESRVGEQFEKLFDDDATEQFENDLEDVLRLGWQIGWLSDDEMKHVGDWRDRLGEVIGGLLSKLGELDDLDQGLRSKFFKKLHGLLTSATALYASAGLDVTFNIRMPNARELARDEDRLEEFLGFMQYTPTKHAGYRDENGYHSIFRSLMEDRPRKLRARLPKEVREGEETAELTASWVINGRGVTELQEEIENAIEAESNRVRERVQEGTEDAPILDIPVVKGGTRGHTRRLVREVAGRKNFDGADVDALVDVLHAYLGGDQLPAPRDVVDVLESLAQKDTVRDRLVPQSLAVGLAVLPEDRLLPGLPPAATRMLQTLLAEGEALTSEELIEATSKRSYERHRQALLATDLVEEAAPGEFVAYVEPWWAADLDEPRNEDHGSVVERTHLGQVSALFDVFLSQEYDVLEAHDWELFAGEVDPDELVDAFPGWEWFIRFAWSLLDDPGGEEATTRVILGHSSAERDADQAALPQRPR